MIKVGNFVFKPGLWPSLVTLLLLPILLSLGFWQLQRAEEKRVIQQQFERQLQQPLLELNKLTEVNELSAFRQASAHGHYVANTQFLLDNIVHNRQAGFYVVTPLRLSDTGHYILVNRGWVAGTADRSKPPEYKTPASAITVTGMLRTPSKPGLALADKSYTQQQWPIVLQWLDLNEIGELTGFSLLPYVLHLDKNAQSGFVREWKLVNTMPEKSTSYAVQWFSLAAALLIIFLVVNTKKTQRHDDE